MSMRITGGRLGDGFLSCVAVRDRRSKAYFFLPEASRYSRLVIVVMTNFLRAKAPTVSTPSPVTS